jgi:hypothetical protein
MGKITINSITFVPHESISCEMTTMDTTSLGFFNNSINAMRCPSFGRVKAWSQIEPNKHLYIYLKQVVVLKNFKINIYNI